ncbi:MAG: biotin--[acetyl-CoA-carboxylase] ligase [Acidimicrobiia bacterium]|nr:biotin--[acetyl-CoA-carboxylase] ligase [Acidimicrobiia bacterium]MDH4309269.1 biotin--[acetyl-CoA-carboxylase] ligase [Acidimicrobiia bacterium]
MPTPYSVIRLDETESTQDVAREHFAGTPLLVVAARQTAGRGRSGAIWETAPRAVGLSLATNLEWEPARWPLVPLISGVVAAELLDCTLKWPNDLMMGEAKIGGILVEVADAVAVIGMGLNLWWPDPPPYRSGVFREDPGPEAGLGLGNRWSDAVIRALAMPPSEWPHDRFVARCVSIGQTVTWDPGGAGTVTGVDGDGSLVVETPAGRQTLRAGEIRHVRPAS